MTQTVNAKGLVTAAAQQAIAITASQVTDFNNAAEDAVGGILLDSATIDFTYVSHTSITGIVIDNSITNAKLRQGVARSVIGVTGNATANEADIQGTTDQVLRVNGAGTALGFGAIDLSKSAAAGGVLQAASFPALTGDLTTVAGALATTLATVNANVGTFGSATQSAQVTVNGKGLVTAVSNVTISGVAPPDGDKGDITVSSTGAVWTIDDDVVTFPKMQNILTDSLIGRDTAGTGDPENIGLNATLSMDGAGNLQRAALSGDISASAGSNTTAIGANKVTSAMLRQGVARSVIGVTGNATANVADIQGTTDQVLRINGAGTALAFGAIDLSKSAAATGVLQAASFPALTGDLTTVAGALASTLATVNANVGTFGDVSNVAQVTVNAKGLVTAVSNISISGTYVLKAGDTMTGPLISSTGTALLPAFAIGEASTGWWLSSTGIPELTLLGTGKMRISATGIQFARGGVIANPADLLELNSTGQGRGHLRGQLSAEFYVEGYGTGINPSYNARVATGTIAAPGVIPTGAIALRMVGQAHDGTTYRNAGDIRMTVDAATPSSTDMQSSIEFRTNDAGSVTPSATMNVGQSTGLSMFGSVVVDTNRLIQLRSTTIAGALTGATAKLGYFNDLGGGANSVIYDGTTYKRTGENGYATLATNADATLSYLTTSNFLQHTGTLTAIRTLTLSTTGAVAGAWFTVYRTGTGNFPLNVVGAITASLFIGQFVTFRYDGSAWQQTDFGTVAPTEVVRKLKTTGENRNATTVLSNDATLQFPMAANVTYRFTMKAFYDTLAAADLKWRTTGPSGATAVRIKRGDIAPSATAMENVAVDVAYSAADIVALTAGTTGGYIEMEGIIQNGATAGTFALQWAQNTSTVGNSTMLAGSWLEYQVIA
jgi:hypothetical protein